MASEIVRPHDVGENRADQNEPAILFQNSYDCDRIERGETLSRRRDYVTSVLSLRFLASC